MRVNSDTDVIQREKIKSRARWTSRFIFFFMAFFTVIYLLIVFQILMQANEAECVTLGGRIVPVFFPDDFLIECKRLGLNEIGDYFAGTTSFLAIFWVIMAFIWQVRELRAQINEFEISNTITRDRLKVEARWQTTQTVFELSNKLREELYKLIKLRGEITDEECSYSFETFRGLIETTINLRNLEKIKSTDEVEDHKVVEYHAMLEEAYQFMLILKTKIPESDLKLNIESLSTNVD